MSYFTDDNGNESITRVAFVYGMMWSTIFTTVYSFMKTISVGEIIALWNGLSGAFFALKLGQKWVEKKLESKEITKLETPSNHLNNGNDKS